MDSSPDIKDMKYYFLQFIQDFIEILILYTLYQYLMVDRDVNIKKSLSISLILSLVSVLLEIYNPVFKNYLKTGLFTSVGGGILKL